MKTPLERTLVDAVVKVKPPAPGAAYWCAFCGKSFMPGANPPNGELDRHLSGECGREIIRQVEAEELASV